MASPLSGAEVSVAAHNLLNSSSVVVLATSLLRDNWEVLSDRDRVEMLNRLARHAEVLAAGLKELVRTGEGPSIVRHRGSCPATTEHRADD